MFRGGDRWFPGMTLLSCGAGHPLWSAANDRVSACVDQNKKYTKHLDPELSFLPSPSVLREHEERQKKLNSRWYDLATFYPLLPLQSFVMREYSRLTCKWFPSEAADGMWRKRHVSLASEGCLTKRSCQPFLPPVLTRSYVSCFPDPRPGGVEWR